MTRETKIGLLVGLAFIIVIGILLSDHLTSSTEPPQAPLANAGSTVRQAVTVPGSPAPTPAAVSPAANTAPQNPVPTQSELTPRPDPVQIVSIGPGTSPQSPGAQPTDPVVTVGGAGGEPRAPIGSLRNQSPTGNPANAASSSATVPPTASADPPITRVAPSGSASPVDQLARQHGEELVSMDGSGRPSPRPHITGTPLAGSPARGGATEYKAEPGDSLSRMATQFLGANTKANREAIVAANPSLRENPDKVIVGRTYLIPTSAAVAPASSGAAPIAPPSAIVSDTPSSTASPAGTEYWYTVKEGDSLWRIAKEQLGRGSAVAAIKELNKGVLSGDNGDVVTVGMKLRLPGRPIAQAN